MEKDYEKLGLIAGLEIHQQLDVGSKLFCHCPDYLRTDKPDVLIRRKLHKVAGETGEIDLAVQYEAMTDKEFFYEGYSGGTCLLEYDEAPPYPINEKALDEVLKIALLFNCEIYPAAQIMRKTVINGSNTSGFQRTVLIAHNGLIKMGFGNVGIKTIALEEDAARIVEKTDKGVLYRLDRLGIPLIEITTEPDMKTPEETKETALKIGEILRACKVKRGIGTIRQDLNINIKGHGRVEIKGFQEPKIMIKTIDLEIERQLKNLQEGKTEGEVRNSKEDGSTDFLRPMPGKDRMYPETDLPLLRISRERINDVKKILPRLKTDIRAELEKKGLNNEMIDLILNSGDLDEFLVLMKVYDKDANLVAKMVSLWRNELATKMKKSVEDVKEVLSERIMEQVLERVSAGKLDKGHVKEVLFAIASGKNFESATKIEKAGDDELEEGIRNIIKEKPGLRPNAYMGLVMAKMKGKVDAKKAMEILNRIIED